MKCDCYEHNPEYCLNECSHEFNCLQEEQIDNDTMAYTYECNICDEIRTEYQSIKTQELLDEYEIIKAGNYKK